MEHLALGIFLVISGALYRRGRRLEIIAARCQTFSLIAMILSGIIFLLIGAFIISVKRPIELPRIAETLTLFIAYFYLLIYARVLNIAETTPSGRELFLRNDVPIFWVTRIAFYSGVFVTRGPLVTVIHGCQIMLALIFGFLVKLVFF